MFDIVDVPLMVMACVTGYTDPRKPFRDTFDIEFTDKSMSFLLVKEKRRAPCI